jgi:ubiquinone/menaquinone biosynthesis C-methylase UbiE
MARIDYERVAADYARSRAMSLESVVDVRLAVERRLPDPTRRIIDVGSGAGSFAYAFAEWFGVHVVGVEPSAAMVEEACAGFAHERAAYVRGDAQRLPVADATFDVAWLSTVIHHLPDLGAAARDVRRVVRAGGVALVRSSFPGRHDGITLFRWFPGASRVASTFPTVEQTVSAFEAAGFRMDGIEAVPQASAPDLRTFLERVRLRADTTLRLMPDDEYEAGVAALARDVELETERRPIIDHIDVMTFVS